MFSILSHKPVLGASFGFLSFMMAKFVHFLTDDDVLKVVGGLGAWLGLIVVILTLVLRIIDVIEKRNSKRQTPNNHV